ncbi:unnamed protein product [Heterobilharzia americana]|nr:unnamed protein product [Heterobilharzia americana]
MDLLNSYINCVNIVQTYLDSFDTRLDSLKDNCVFANPVNIICDQVQSGIIISVVQNHPSNQSALFIFSRKKNFVDNQYDISELTDLIPVDENFSCEDTDSTGQLQVSGKRVVDISSHTEPANQQLKLYVISNSVNKPLNSKVNTSDIDSDEESNPGHPVFLKSLKDTSGKATDKSSIRLSPVSFTLEFDKASTASKFRETALHLSSEYSMKISESVNRCITGDRISYEVGKEALNTLNPTPSERLLWLQNYWKHVEHSSSIFNTSSPCLTQTDVNMMPVGVNGENVSSISETHNNLHSSCSSIGSLNNINVKQPQSYETEKSTNNIHNNSSLSNSKQKTATKHSSKLHHSKSSISLHSSKLSHPLDDRSTSVNHHQCIESVEKNSISFSNNPSHCTIATAHSCTDLTFSPIPYDDQSDKSEKYLEPRIFRARFNQAGNLIQKKLTERMNEYCKNENIRLYVGTWNVNGRSDNCMQLDDWLMPPDGQPPADIYVFGFQEMDLSLSVITLNKTSSSGPEEKWIQQLEEALDGLLKRPSSTSIWAHKTGVVKSFPAKWSHFTGGGYLRVERVRLAGMMMIVYISARLSSHLHRDEISCQVVPTGVFNVMGNKGGVGIRLTIFNSSLCFVNCHLAAGEANLDRRNQDFREIVRKMIFELPMNSKNVIHPPERSFILDHDIIFVFGDLNYRIVGLDSGYVRRSIFGKDFNSLLRNDELLKQFENRKAFEGFHEPVINFAPTYKFDMNSNIYDSSDKNRVPSYCDRILWSGQGCEPIAYRSHPAFVCSDHKPVSGYFSVSLRRIKRAAFQRTYESVLLSIDLTTNLSLPQAELDRQELNFDFVHFHELCSQTLTLTNIGLNDFQFKFLREGVGAFPSWLTVSPSCDWVKQGTSMNLEFQIFVNYKEVYALNSGSAKLSTIVVLQLEDGKDYFISIIGQFIPTCFGLPLFVLLTMGSDPVTKIPIAELQEQIKLARSENNEYFRTKLCNLSVQKPFHVPKEIFRLVNHINEYITEPDLFRQMGPSSDIALIRDILDTTTASCPFPETISVHSIASCLLLFLNTLPESVIPSPFQEKCLNSLANFECAVQALQYLPISNQNLFYYLIIFMQRCLTFKEHNGTDIDLLASCFGEIFFLESPPTTPSTAITNAQKNALAVKQLKRTAFISIFLRYNYLLSISPLTSPR